MPVGPEIVRYIFELSGKRLSFDIDTSIEGKTQPDSDETLPEWTRLDYHQCDCCPLRTEDCSHCPAAVRTHEFLTHFKDDLSVEEVRLTVETHRRTYSQACDMQTGINSMLGLLMATSGCPVVGKLRSMASFHLPYSSFVETIYRTLGAYLIKQYFIQQEGGDPDWTLQGLRKFYEDLEGLNRDYTERIRAITTNDAIANALIIFFSTSIVVESALEDELLEYKDFFTGKTTCPPDA